MKLKTKIALWIVTPIFLTILLAILLTILIWWIFIKMLHLLGILDAFMYLLEITKKKIHHLYFQQTLTKEDRDIMNSWIKKAPAEHKNDRGFNPKESYEMLR